jgi:hypothetical protein
VYGVGVADCDTEVAALERGLVCPDVADVERDPGGDAKFVDLETGLDS